MSLSRPALVAAALLLSSCRDTAFTEASKVDTAEAYRRFIETHPRDDNADVAKARLSELEFSEAQQVHSVIAYKRYLEAWPDGDQAPKARALLESLRWNAAKDKGTTPALRQFLKDHPDGAHHEDAEKLLGELELKELATLDDPRRLAEVAAAHPDDPRSATAGQRLDDVVFGEARSAALLFAYLREYPAGAHRDEARARLLSLQLDGLLASGLLDEARALAAKAPLAKTLKDLAERFRRAEARAALPASRDERVQRVLAGYHLRSIDDLLKSLQAPDPMDRWQAAEELGQQASVRVLDPLLEAFKTARVPLVRQKAFESLASVLRALPRDVAEYEVAARVEAAREKATDSQLVLAGAALLDLSGQLERAAAEYRRAWDSSFPDPVVLRRWAEIRQERGQYFSAAVAARQLAVWAQEQARAAGPFGPTNALSASRDLCAVAEAARFARDVIEQARAKKTEFPDDVEVFALRSRDAAKLAEARLRDAELALLELDGQARRCGDDAVKERLDNAVQVRLAALADLRKKPPRELPLVLEVVRERDPSARVREAAGP